ncbi:SCO6880 family protein [Williamsia sp.]|uniref:SCO6880 family protein n=1 Tax=Williamsia sp. TaxID=1872085 RepID=UPI0034530E29
MTTTVVIPDRRQRPTYGGWISMKSTFAFGFTKLAAAVAATAVIAMFVVMFAVGAIQGLIVLVVSSVFVAPLAISINGRTIYEEVVSMRQWSRQKSRGQNILRAGPLSNQPGGRCRLPGVSAATEMWWSKDTMGNEFGMIRMRATSQYTVLLRCTPQGDRNIEQDTIDEWVGSWGYFLAALGQSSDIDGCVVVVESLPDTGAAVRTEVESLCSNGNAPELAKRVIREHVPQVDHGGQRISARMALTFRARTPERRRDPMKMALEIGTRLPALYHHMARCGVACEPMLDQEIAGVTRIAYDPEAQEDVEASMAARDKSMVWEDAGPIAVDETKKTYHHDSGVSRSWVMRVPPAGTISERVLKPLLAPRGDIRRKRVAIIYRPHTAADASRIIDRDYKSALAKASQSRGPVAPAAKIGVAATAKAREEEAQGHGLSRFAIIVTVTGLDEDELDLMVPTATDLMAQTRMKMRVAFRTQAATFAAGLGVGVLLPDHITAPKALGG